MSTLIWWLGKKATAIYAVLALSYMMLPIVIVIALSFNKPPGRQNTQFSEFSFDAWTNICRDQTICSSFGTSIKIGLLVTIISTIVGTMISFALIRHRYRGRGATSLLIFLPLATPEVILGASLLALFLIHFGITLIPRFLFVSRQFPTIPRILQ